MNPIKIVLITLLIAQPLLSGPTMRGCVSLRNENECYICNDHAMYRYNDGTGRVACNDQDGPIVADRCKMYSTGADGCWWCTEGYYRKIDPRGDRTCHAQFIFGCAFSVTRNGVQQCVTCINGYPSEDRSSCIPFGDEDFAYQCNYGTRDNSEHMPGPSCFKCKEGFTSVGGICRGVNDWPKLAGCQVSYDENNCLYCDWSKRFVACMVDGCHRCSYLPGDQDFVPGHHDHMVLK